MWNNTFLFQENGLWLCFEYINNFFFEYISISSNFSTRRLFKNVQASERKLCSLFPTCSFTQNEPFLRSYHSAKATTSFLSVTSSHACTTIIFTFNACRIVIANVHRSCWPRCKKEERRRKTRERKRFSEPERSTDVEAKKKKEKRKKKKGRKKTGNRPVDAKAGETRSNHAGPLSRGRLADFVGRRLTKPHRTLRSRLIGSDRADRQVRPRPAQKLNKGN